MEKEMEKEKNMIIFEGKYLNGKRNEEEKKYHDSRNFIFKGNQTTHYCY